MHLLRVLFTVAGVFVCAVSSALVSNLNGVVHWFQQLNSLANFCCSDYKSDGSGSNSNNTHLCTVLVNFFVFEQIAYYYNRAHTHMHTLYFTCVCVDFNANCIQCFSFLFTFYFPIEHRARCVHVCLWLDSLFFVRLFKSSTAARSLYSAKLSITQAHRRTNRKHKITHKNIEHGNWDRGKKEHILQCD